MFLGKKRGEKLANKEKMFKFEGCLYNYYRC